MSGGRTEAAKVTFNHVPCVAAHVGSTGHICGTQQQTGWFNHFSSEGRKMPAFLVKKHATNDEELKTEGA